MMSGPIPAFFILLFWMTGMFAKPPERKGFWGAEFVDFKGSLQLLNSSHQREEITCC